MNEIIDSITFRCRKVNEKRPTGRWLAFIVVGLTITGHERIHNLFNTITVPI